MMLFNGISWHCDPDGSWRIIYRRFINGREYHVWFPVQGPGCGGVKLDKLAHEAFCLISPRQEVDER